jgi:hypothetical protein
MKRLPLLVDDHPSLLVRAGLFALVPVALVLLLPILLLLVIALYLSAIFHGVRVVVTVVSGKQTPPDFEMQKPHFLEMQAQVRALPDESRNLS